MSGTASPYIGTVPYVHVNNTSCMRAPDTVEGGLSRTKYNAIENASENVAYMPIIAIIRRPAE